MAEMLKYEENVGAIALDFIDGECREIAESHAQRWRQGHSANVTDFRVYSQRRIHLWATVSATPTFDAEGKSSGVLR